jgi:hypothetical protein
MDSSNIRLNPLCFAHYVPPQVYVADDVGGNNDDRTTAGDNWLDKTDTDSQSELMASARISRVAPPPNSMREQQRDDSEKPAG